MSSFGDSTPAVTIDPFLKVAGRMPKAEEVQGWLAVALT